MTLDTAVKFAVLAAALLLTGANGQTDCTNSLYELKTLDNEASPFEVFTGEDGTLWALFATDSGFEGTTGIYFTRLEIRAEEI